MSRLIIVFLILAGSAAAAAQTPPSFAVPRIATVEDYASVMKSNAEAGAAMNKALTAGAYPEARLVLSGVRRNFVALQRFWTQRKRADAVAIVKDGLTQIDTLDRMLANDAELSAVGEVSRTFGRTTCAACHKLYRDGDEQTGFRFKPGVF
jgi:hypothetical protein